MSIVLHFGLLIHLSLQLCVWKKAFWTFWLALDCYCDQYLSYIHTSLFFTTFCSQLYNYYGSYTMEIKTFYLTTLKSLISVSASSFLWHISWTILCLSLPYSFGVSLLFLLQILLKWLLCPHFLQSFPNARYLQGSFVVPQYLHLCMGLFFVWDLCPWGIQVFVSTLPF